MASGNIKAWITVRGRHIPIMEGENKASALANHFKNLRKEHRSKLEKKYNEGQKKVDELRKNLQDAKNSNNAPMTRFYEKKLSDASEEQFKTTNRIADSYRTIKGRAKTVNEKKKEAFDEMNENTRRVNKEREDYEKRKGTSLTSSETKVFSDRILEENKNFRETLSKLRNEKTKRYKLKEDTPKQETAEKRKIIGVKKPYLNENPEYTAFARYKPKNQMRKVTDSDYRDKKSFRNDLKANEFDRISIKDRRDMYVMNNTNYTSVNQLKKIVKGMKETESKYGFEAGPRKRYEDVLNKANKISLQKPKTFKDTSGKARKLVVKNAYEKYMKEHPNSKMKLSVFEKTYKK